MKSTGMKNAFRHVGLCVEGNVAAKMECLFLLNEEDFHLTHSFQMSIKQARGGDMMGPRAGQC